MIVCRFLWNQTELFLTFKSCICCDKFNFFNVISTLISINGKRILKNAVSSTVTSSGSPTLLCSWSRLESDYLKNVSETHMTNKSLRGVNHSTD